MLLTVEGRFEPGEGEKGFTVVELLVVTVLMAIVGGVVLSGLISGMGANEQAQSRIDAYNELQVAVERVSRELRAADPVIDFEPALVSVRVFREGNCHAFTYEVDGSELREHRATGPDCDSLPATTARPLIRDLDPGPAEPVFEFADVDGEEPDSADDIATIKLTFQRSLRDQPSVTVSTLVSVRNR
jgi:prepilin-type N-terminal cleavage/methylation domain-containing protein